MRIVLDRKPLPRVFAGYSRKIGLLAEFDVTPTRHGRLAAKVLVFDKPKSLRNFWNKINPSDLGRDCLGAVNGLSEEVTRFGRRDGSGVTFMRADPRYFCLIGLCKNHLTTEIVVHESVHAGYAYAKRVRRDLFGHALRLDEELVAYPAGAIAAGINDRLHKAGMYAAN